MKEHLTEGGWEDYIRKIKSQLDNPPTKEQYSSMMRMYLDRVNIDDAVKRLKGGKGVNEEYFKRLEGCLDSYTLEETKKRLDSYGVCLNDVTMGEWLTEYKERMINLALYGNSWSNEELQIILNEEKMNDN